MRINSHATDYFVFFYMQVGPLVVSRCVSVAAVVLLLDRSTVVVFLDGHLPVL